MSWKRGMIITAALCCSLGCAEAGREAAGQGPEVEQPAERTEADGPDVAANEPEPSTAPGEARGATEVSTTAAGDGEPSCTMEAGASLEVSAAEVRDWSRELHPDREDPREGPLTPHSPEELCEIARRAFVVHRARERTAPGQAPRSYDQFLRRARDALERGDDPAPYRLLRRELQGDAPPCEVPDDELAAARAAFYRYEHELE